MNATGYRGRLAPSPTGFLHLGHARTFWTAQTRAREAGGTLVLRIEDLDGSRCRPEFLQAIYEDLRWFGLAWQEGPDVGGPCSPYLQSLRRVLHRTALDQLKSSGVVYPCYCSRKDVLDALNAPHAGTEEPLYPGTCHPRPGFDPSRPGRTPSWRFRVTPGETITFVDGLLGFQRFVAGTDFGDFVVWRHDGLPSYQLAVVVDDAAMRITEVVRGEDLLLSTARQLLLYRALSLVPPSFCHCHLVTDQHGQRLAKRNDALALRTLRVQGSAPEKLRPSSPLG